MMARADDDAQQPSRSSDARPDLASQKRTASAAGLDGIGGAAQARAVKRRASKACQSCRARKVRCNVVYSSPCTNCKLDEVPCIVSESRRKKKLNKLQRGTSIEQPLDTQTQFEGLERPSLLREVSGTGSIVDTSALKTDSFDPPYQSFATLPVPHSTLNGRLSPSALSRATSSPRDLRSQYYAPPTSLPHYVKPLPPQIGLDEAQFLDKKGALSVPAVPFRNALLKAYIEFVHPFVPLLDLQELVSIIELGNGANGRISLIVLQAVMFAGTAFCDMEHLRQAGYSNRRAARKDFFQRTRLLYDFDYEKDRLALVQAILLLTYYYETPDDQKDTWHWMGVAATIAQTIGLHRNPENSKMEPKKKKLWRRIWWSLYMRDRLIALGMRRPTRARSEDCDVPMLTMDDFDISPISEAVMCVPFDTLIARNIEHQRQMAVMCIEKAKLCVCITNILSKHYTTLNNQQGISNDRTTMMLLPKSCDLDAAELQACDDELESWLANLPVEAQYGSTLSGNPAIDVNKSLLHMIFMTTLSALHRPPVLPTGTPGASENANSNMPPELLAVSRKNVHRAATAITNIAAQLDAKNLVRYLPNTGVAVLLPAIIVHLLDIKSEDEQVRRTSLRGFCQCMSVMAKLRDIHAAADYSTAFLEAAIRKAGIQLAPAQEQFVNPAAMNVDSPEADARPQTVTGVDALVDAGRRMEMADSQSPASQQTPTLSTRGPTTMTPPPDKRMKATLRRSGLLEDDPGRRLESFMAASPPGSELNGLRQTRNRADARRPTSQADDHMGSLQRDKDSTGQGQHPQQTQQATSAGSQGNVTGFTLDLTNDVLFPMWQNMPADFDDGDFESLLNLDGLGEAFSFEGGLEAAVKLQDEGLGAAGMGSDVWDV